MSDERNPVDGKHRRSFEELLFTRPADVPGWTARPAPQVGALHSWYVALVVIVPLLVLFHFVRFNTELTGRLAQMTTLAEQSSMFREVLSLFLTGACMLLSGLLLTLMFSGRIRRLRRQIRHSDLVLKAISDDFSPDDDEQMDRPLKRLDQLYLEQRSAFGRARIIGHNLSYYMGLSKRPALPALSGIIAMLAWPICSLAIEVALIRSSDLADLQLAIYLLSTLAWQWGLHQLLTMSAGLGVFREHVRVVDMQDRRKAQ